ncbi:MAG: VCBS repeat-containing protein [Verrucomicrobiales bacterium]
MSKRKLIFGALGALLLTAVAVGFHGWRSGWFGAGDPVFTDVIPETRPKRLDHRQLERFSGQPIETILETLIAEKEAAAKTNVPESPVKSAEEALLDLLPDAPLPFSSDAVPKDEAGLKAFVTGMQQDEEGQPTKSEQWQFNLALAALGVDQSKVPEAIRQNARPLPESETYPVRLADRRCELTGAFAVGNLNAIDSTEIVAGGGSALFRIKADGTLEPLDDLKGITPGNGVYPGDYDGDGDLDLFITREDGLPNSLLRNEVEGKFEDVTIATGLLSFNDTTAAAWIDYDNDGLLDLLVASRDHPLELYHQTAAGIFQPVAWDLKLWLPRGGNLIEVADFSGDGFPDFLLGIEGRDDRLYLTKSAGAWSEWRFEDQATAAGLAGAAGTTTSASFFDFDLDGNTDLLLTKIESKEAPDTPASSQVETTVTGSLRLFRNEGEGNFAEVTEMAGLPGDERVTSAGIVDLDNDGYEDVFLGTGPLSGNRVYWNREGSGFMEISVVSRGSYLDEPVAFDIADPNADGKADIFYLNRTGRIRWLEAGGAMDRWIHLKVTGQPTGTRVSLSFRDKDWVLRSMERPLGLESSMTIGLGQATLIEHLDLFAGNEVEALKTLEKIEPNQTLLVELPKRPKQRAVVPMEDAPVKPAAP